MAFSNDDPQAADLQLSIHHDVEPLQGSVMGLVLYPGPCPGLSHDAPSGLKHSGQGDALGSHGALRRISIIAPRGQDDRAQGNALGAKAHFHLSPEGAKP